MTFNPRDNSQRIYLALLISPLLKKYSCDLCPLKKHFVILCDIKCNDYVYVDRDRQNKHFTSDKLKF